MTSYQPNIVIFLIKKAKIAKSVLDKRGFATSIAVLILQFLSVEKRKYIFTIGLTSY